MRVPPLPRPPAAPPLPRPPAAPPCPPSMGGSGGTLRNREMVRHSQNALFRTPHTWGAGGRGRGTRQGGQLFAACVILFLMRFLAFRVPVACAWVFLAALSAVSQSARADGANGAGDNTNNTAPAPSVSVKDARFGWNFPYSVTLTKPDGKPRLIVHYQTQGDAPIAEQTARLFARVMRLHQQHFGMETAFFHDADYADVWLAAQRPETANDGGETRQNQLYVFGIHDTRRTKLEWVRTLVHEWGHLTLPAARGYQEPENDASGYLGERLYMKWLHDEAQTVEGAANANDGTNPADLEKYYTRQIAPLMARFNRPEADGGGPNAPVLLQKNTRAMDGYIGAVCALDTAWGSPATGRTVFGILGTNAPDFFASARMVWLREAQKGPVSLQLPAWVPVNKGAYRLTTENGKTRTLTQTQIGWKYLDGVGSASLTRIGKP